MKRVVVTGIAGFSPIGHEWVKIRQHLTEFKTAIRYMDSWACYRDLNTRLAAPIDDFEIPAHYTRKKMRSMGRVAQFAVRATELALEQAGLLGDPLVTSGQMGVSYGSSAGDSLSFGDFSNMLTEKSSDGLNANSYIKMMAHTSPVNIGIFFGVKGRVLTTSSACTSASQGIGYAYEAIRHGQQLAMIAGGCEALCPTEAAVFDTLYATSTQNDHPELTPRPFDEKRDGLVIGEGACTFILEELEHAKARGAHIIAELVGFGTNSDGAHITQPSSETMKIAMELSLKSAGLSPENIGYISAHGTATDKGDIAESHATHGVFGNRVPVSALKSFTGHTLGACGSLEAWVALEMMKEKWFHGTANLTHPDPLCAEVDFIQHQEHRVIDCEHIMTNNFAFGGINTSLIFKLY